jgi:outer membrane lipoprotein-sorting protein
MSAALNIKKYFFMILLLFPLYAAGQSASEILDRSIKLLYGESAIAICDVKIIRPAVYDKKYKMKFYNKGRKKMLAQFLAPAREVGRALLCNGDVMRLYLPDIAKSIRISPEQLFLGSDFTHRDLLQLDLEQDYESKLLPADESAGDSCFVLELTAKNGNVAYNKIKFWIGKKDYLPVRQEYFSLSGKLLKVLLYTQPQKMGGLIRPSVLSMINVLHPQDKTVIIWLELQTDVALSDYLFTQQYLDKQQ